MLELRNISKSYGNLRVLDDVSLDVRDNEVLAIVGASGAGKTTLLQIAGTLLRPDSGSISLDGTDLLCLKDRRLSAFRNLNLGFIFQFHQLLPEFTAVENVAIPAMIGGMSRRKAEARGKELLDMLGLGARLSHKPAQLSGGEKQRVAIARALVNSPSIVFADEPTGSLDSVNRQEIQSLFSQLNQSLRQTFVIVTHDPGLASVADRVLTKADGRIISEEVPGLANSCDFH